LGPPALFTDLKPKRRETTAILDATMTPLNIYGGYVIAKPVDSPVMAEVTSPKPRPGAPESPPLGPTYRCKRRNEAPARTSSHLHHDDYPIFDSDDIDLEGTKADVATPNEPPLGFEIARDFTLTSAPGWVHWVFVDRFDSRLRGFRPDKRGKAKPQGVGLSAGRA
jgi:hypothetical protein